MMDPRNKRNVSDTCLTDYLLLDYSDKIQNQACIVHLHKKNLFSFNGKNVLYIEELDLEKINQTSNEFLVPPIDRDNLNSFGMDIPLYLFISIKTEMK